MRSVGPLTIVAAGMFVAALFPGAADSQPTAREPGQMVAVDCTGGLAVDITAVDGVAVTRTDHAALSQAPLGSTFVFSHTLTVHNYGATTAKTLALTTTRSWQDSAALAGATSLTVSTSADGFTTAAALPTYTVTGLEAHPSVPVPLTTVLNPGGDLQIRLSWSAQRLDNSLQGTAMSPSLRFTFGG